METLQVGKLYETVNGIKVICIMLLDEQVSLFYDYDQATIIKMKNDELFGEWTLGREWTGVLTFDDPKSVTVLKGEPINWDYLVGKTAQVSIKVL